MKKLDKKPSTKISKEDLEVWNKFLSQTNTVEDKDQKLHPNNPGSSSNSFDFRIDLHGYTIDEAFQKIDQLMHYAEEKKIKKILVITGKGLHSNKDQDPYVSKDLSLLKYAVPDYLQKNFSKKIVSIEPSPIKLGGEGSMIVTLRKL